MNFDGVTAFLSSEEQFKVKLTEQEHLFNHLLTKARAFYNINRGALTSDEQKMRVIVSFLNQQIFDMSIYKWCINLSIFKSMPDSFTNEKLGDYVYDRINYKIGQLSLSAEELAFYKNHVLSKSLPTIALQLSAAENLELNDLIVTQQPWGFAHAGAMLLTESNAKIEVLRLADIQDVGAMLYTMLIEGAVPQEYIGYFRLPALLYHAGIYGSLPGFLLMSTQYIRQVYHDYFNYLKDWGKSNNPLLRLQDLIVGWKTRRILAKELLRPYGIEDNDGYVSRYLNSHSETQFEIRKWTEVRDRSNLFDVTGIGIIRHPAPSIKVSLPNIDNIFEEQNRQLADTAYEVDKLLLPIVFNSLSEDEQHFIEQSKVDRIRMQFNAMDSIRSAPLAPSARQGIRQSGALIYHIHDHIDLLQCTLNGE